MCYEQNNNFHVVNNFYFIVKLTTIVNNNNHVHYPKKIRILAVFAFFSLLKKQV